MNFNAIAIDKAVSQQKVALASLEQDTLPEGDVLVREKAWRRLARDLKPETLETVACEIGLADAVAAASDVLAGKVKGRLVVNVNRPA